MVPGGTAMKNTVGKNIVKLRKEQGMSQEQLAQKLHVTRQARVQLGNRQEPAGSGYAGSPGKRL